MKRLLLFVLTAALASAQPVPVIFDTDMGNDIDDALALAVLHSLQSRGEARLAAVTITKDNAWAAAYVDLVNHFYGRRDIPIGVVRGGKTPEDSKYIRIPAERKTADGRPVYPRKLQDGTQAREAVEVLRKTLAAEKDHTVVMIQVGFGTNLARLLDSPPDAASPLAGRDLVAKKVRLLSIMAGQFPTGNPEYNVREDLPAAKKLFSDWPTPLVASGFEVGEALLYPGRSIQTDYRYVQNHPIAEAYRLFEKMPYDRPTWDLTAALYAVRPDRGYFSVSPEGTISVAADGRTTFRANAGGRHRYLNVDDIQRVRTLEALVQLASQPAFSHRRMSLEGANRPTAGPPFWTDRKTRSRAVEMWESRSDFQGRWARRETCRWFSSASCARHFHRLVPRRLMRYASAGNPRRAFSWPLASAGPRRGRSGLGTGGSVPRP